MKATTIRAAIMRILAAGEENAINIGTRIRAITGGTSQRSTERYLAKLVSEGFVTRVGAPMSYRYSNTKEQREAFARKETPHAP